MKTVLATLSLCVAAVAAASAGHHVHSMNKDTVSRARALNEMHDRNQERKKRNRGKHLNAGGGVDIERTPRGVEKPKRRGNPENVDAGSTPKQQMKGLEAEELELAEEKKIAKHEARKKEKQRKRHKNETEVEDEGTFEDLEVEETHGLATANVTETTATLSTDAPPEAQTFAASIQQKHGHPVKSDRKADKDKPGPGPAKKGEDQAEVAAASQQLENNSSSKKATILVSSMLGALLMFLM